jgi:CRP-like cAMP-binding protein
MNAQEITTIRDAIPLFSQLTDDELGEILAISQIYKAPKGVMLLEEGQPGHGMYVVIQGMLTCRLQLFQGDDVHLANLYKGDVVGEMTLIDGQLTSATVTTISDCILYHIDKIKFDELRHNMRPSAFKVLRALAPTLCVRLRAINSRIGEVFIQPEKHMRLMQRRYAQLSKHGHPLDAPSD